MGIQGLAKLIADVAPEAIREVDLASFFGRRIAIDASMSLYQFLVAIRYSNHQLTNEAGDATSHIIGFFYRTCKLLEAGIKPIYVFDGKPPQLKSGELGKRQERRAEAQKKLDQATTAAEATKYEKRLVRVNKTHNDDVKKLLRLMGLPVIEAPSEAEAQCAQLVKENLVYGVATEDMDALTFGATKLIRNLSSGSGEKVKEYDLTKVTQGLGLTHQQFIDLSILMGCDYCDTIKGIGPKKGLDLIKKFDTIENILINKFGITNFVEDVEVSYKGEVVKKEEDVLPAETKDLPATNGKKISAVRDFIKAKVNAEVAKWDADEKKDVFPGMETPCDAEVSPPQSPLKSPKKESDLETSVESNGKDVSFIKSDEETDEDKVEKIDEDSEKDEDKSEDESSEDEKKPKAKSPKAKKSAAKKGKEEKKIESGVPENWLFKGARKLFVEPNVLVNTFTEADMKIKDVDEAGLMKFLVEEQGFSEDRVKTALKRMETFKKKSSQSRIDSFFKAVPKADPSPNKKKPAVTPSKRPNDNKGSKGTGAKRGRKAR